MFEVGLQEVLIVLIGLPVLFLSVFVIPLAGLLALGAWDPRSREELSRRPPRETAPEIGPLR